MPPFNCVFTEQISLADAARRARLQAGEDFPPDSVEVRRAAAAVEEVRRRAPGKCHGVKQKLSELMSLIKKGPAASTTAAEAAWRVISQRLIAEIDEKPWDVHLAVQLCEHYLESGLVDDAIARVEGTSRFDLVSELLCEDVLLHPSPLTVPLLTVMRCMCWQDLRWLDVVVKVCKADVSKTKSSESQLRYLSALSLLCRATFMSENAKEDVGKVVSRYFWCPSARCFVAFRPGNDPPHPFAVGWMRTWAEH